MSYDTPIPFLIAKILEADGLGTFGTSIFVGKEPDRSSTQSIGDNTITIYDTGGLADTTVNTSNNTNYRSGEIGNYQVRVRNNSYTAGHSVMSSIRSSLEKRGRDVTVDGSNHTVTSWLNNLPNNIARDSHNRAIFTANFSSIRFVDETGEAETSSSTSSEGDSSSSSSEDYSSSSSSV